MNTDEHGSDRVKNENGTVWPMTLNSELKTPNFSWTRMNTDEHGFYSH
jgi:hypothetical protein